MIVVADAQPAASQPRLEVSFSGQSAEPSALATAVPLSRGSLWVTVVTPGANARQAALRPAAAGTRMELVGYDPVSRLGFLKVTGDGATAAPAKWLDQVESPSGQTLHAMGPAGIVKGRSLGWVQQVGGKILPLALLRVGFDRTPPPPGSSLCDDEGRVAAVFFQSAGGGNTGYAIPAEAVHRVHRDIMRDGRFVRGWIGLALRAEQQSPQVVRVLPDSPAARSGIRPQDILTRIGDRPVSSYADAVNAFFYLVPGTPVKVRILRGADPIEFTVKPDAQKAG